MVFHFKFKHSTLTHSSLPGNISFIYRDIRISYLLFGNADLYYALDF